MSARGIPEQTTGVHFKEQLRDHPVRSRPTCSHHMYLIEKMQYTGSNRAVKICVYSTVLNWKEPLSQLRQLCFCIVLCILSRAIWRGSFPGFETKYFVNLVFMLQCPVCHCSSISYLVLWKSVQNTFDMSNHVRGESDHYFCPIQEPVTWQRFLTTPYTKQSRFQLAYSSVLSHKTRRIHMSAFLIGFNASTN